MTVIASLYMGESIVAMSFKSSSVHSCSSATSQARWNSFWRIRFFCRPTTQVKKRVIISYSSSSKSIGDETVIV